MVGMVAAMVAMVAMVNSPVSQQSYYCRHCRVTSLDLPLLRRHMPPYTPCYTVCGLLY